MPRMSSPVPNASARSASGGMSSGWDSTAASTLDTPRSITAVASTTPMTVSARVIRVPPKAATRPGPWVITVFQVPQP